MMGIQTMGSQSNGQESHLQASPLTRQSSRYDLPLEPVSNQIGASISWYDLPFEPVGNQIGGLKKPLGSMNLDELLKNVRTEREHASSSPSLLQRQGSSTPARPLTERTVDDVWKEIQQVQKKRFGGEQTQGEVTLEDFLGQAGLSLDTSLSLTSSMRFGTSEDNKFPHCFTPQMGLSPAPSIGSLTESTVTKRKRADPDKYEKTVERRLKRMIKNRESAARSRARKQAYENELVGKVSRLEEENLRLKKEKEFDAKFPGESSLETKYQLRRTNSTSF